MTQDRYRYKTGRPVVHGRQGIVSAGHYLTAMSAMRMLLAGGNAFDAAAAAGFTAVVVEPTASYSLAAEGVFLMHHAQTGQVRVLSGQGPAPGRQTVDLFRGLGLSKIPTGPDTHGELSFTVPGVVDAYITMLETYGSKTLGEVIDPAIDYARRGFPMYQYMRGALQSIDTLEQFRRYPPGGIGVFYDEDESAIKVGQIVIQKSLAATLTKMVEAESAAPGHRLAGLQAARDAFYRGEIAHMIVDSSQRVGGLLSLDDLAGYRARFEEPVMTTFMGYEVCAQSTWTQGPVLLQALNLLEYFDMRAMGHNSPQYIHTVAEAVKLAFADRERFYGDPEFARVPIDGLVSKEYAASRASLIAADTAHPELPASGDPWRYSVTAPSAHGKEVAAVPSAGDAGGGGEAGTTHFAVIDRDGNMVCVTPSGGAFVKSVFFPELGCALSTRSEMFFVDEDHPNGVQPGKRPRTTLVNYIVCKNGQPVMTLGCPGGDNQAQANLQLLLNVLVFGMDPQQAVEVPRFSSQSVTNSFYPREYLPGRLNVEPGIPQETLDRLAGMGHDVVRVSHDSGIGAIVSQRDPETGVMCAGADPRRPTYAIGW